jgi:uncharacterized metal-binding protein
MSRYPATITWVKAHKSEENIAEAAEDTDLVIVLEGCSDHCALKKIIDRGIKADMHLVATELGGERDGMDEVQWSALKKCLRPLNRK